MRRPIKDPTAVRLTFDALGREDRFHSLIAMDR